MVRFAKSCSCALKGILLSLNKERNLRIELSITAFILYISRFYEMSGSDYAVLFVTIGLVLSAEIFNSAMERFVDLMSPKFSEKAGRVKDIAAGGVLIAAILSVVVGISLFFRPDVIKVMFWRILTTPAELAGFIVLIVLCALFIWFGGNKKNVRY